MPASPPHPPRTPSAAPSPQETTASAPRICYSYFALYGDPLLDEEADPYPDALLERLAEVGVNGVWLQGLLNRMAPFPWDPSVSAGWETRMRNLRRLTERAARHGIGVYLYLNEPRAMPKRFHDTHPGLKGVKEGDYAALCTSAPEVQKWISDSMESVCREAPELAGFFTISGSENLTHCWSHGQGAGCLRCGPAGGPAVIADLHRRMEEGIRRSGSKARLIAWDWGWHTGWAEEVTKQLPVDVTLMSVSEWDIPIRRGGVATAVGEYSMSVTGPGPRAQRHWSAAQKAGLPVMAKIQAGNTWELSAVPYIPVADTVVRHTAALRELGVRGLLLGWTLGGYPSPNLEVANLISSSNLSPDEALTSVANRRFGTTLGRAVVKAWKEFSTAFAEFPFHTGVVYSGPLQVGPANLLWAEPTGYKATMVGFPYDDLHGWRAVYPTDVYIGQMLKVADGFDTACKSLGATLRDGPSRPASTKEREAAWDELRLGGAAAIHFRSAANQARFIAVRSRMYDSGSSASASLERRELNSLLRQELLLARRLKRLQEQDSRIGFEASNQYFYTPLDLVEKVLNCRDLLKRWDPEDDQQTSR